MSGGSFDYICYAEADTLLQKYHVLENMRDWLIYKNKIDAAKEIDRFYQDVIMFRRMLEFRLERLQKVMHAAEWWCSNDSGEDDFDKVWQEFLEGKQ